MKIKVCGMKYEDNIRAVESLNPDFMGFIFYPKSPRYVVHIPDANPESFITRVGVFVNAHSEEIIQTLRPHQITWAQLHGEISLTTLQELKTAGMTVVRAVGVGDDFKMSDLEKYYPKEVDYFLFDTLSQQHGGTGKKFNWHHLSEYTYDIPFFLAGGLDIDSLDEAYEWSKKLPLFAVDMNSRLEDAPGLKNTEKTKTAIEKVRSYGRK